MISFIDRIASATTCPPFSATSRDPIASWLACRALSAFCFTVPVISSSEAAVSSRLDACSCAPDDSCSDAAESCTEALAALFAELLTSCSAARMPSTARLSAAAIRPISSVVSSSSFRVKSPSATPSSTSPAWPSGRAISPATKRPTPIASATAPAIRATTKRRERENTASAFSVAFFMTSSFMPTTFSICSSTWTVVASPSMWTAWASGPLLSLASSMIRSSLAIIVLASRSISAVAALTSGTTSFSLNSSMCFSNVACRFL